MLQAGLAEDRGGDHPGFDDSYPDTESTDFACEPFAERLQRPLGGGVPALRAARQASGHARDVDDAALAALTHAGKDSLYAAQRAEEVGLHYAAEIGKRHLLHGTVHADAGVVDEHIDRP